MRKTTYTEPAHTAEISQLPADGSAVSSGLPNRLMTAFEVAEFVGCHEETVRRAYLRGLLTSQRFGVRSRDQSRPRSAAGAAAFASRQHGDRRCLGVPRRLHGTVRQAG
jgi:hypothetical protein